ncbi:hypothetical protein BV898_15638 [Hypsibius exemplaris]|uniref:OTU domain-containing protein n=1 Tax=Hypsibius exemplaris TaxID=2072580 RepID=A0A9X6RKP7_HYPEX|nr:hypothetical protein BV898_15638 [Hypsibius exemplaris]
MTTRVSAPLEDILHELGQLIDHNYEPDGNCLFRALSMLLYGTEDRWDEVKAQILSYAETRPDWLMQFFDNNISADNDADDRTFVYFLRDLDTANAWRGEHCIGIACRLFKINIWTFSHAHWETYTRGDRVNDHQKLTSTWVEIALVGGDVAGQPYALLIYKNANHYHAAVRNLLLTARISELTAAPQPVAHVKSIGSAGCEFIPVPFTCAPFLKSPLPAKCPSDELLGKPATPESLAPPRLSTGISRYTLPSTHCLSLPPKSIVAVAETPQFTTFLAPDKQILFYCYREAGRVCKGKALKAKLLEMFQNHYPDFQQMLGILLRRYFDFAKERERISSFCPATSISISANTDRVVAQLLQKKSVAKFAWTDESKQCLGGLVAEITAQNGEVWSEILRRFRSFHPECALADNSIRTRFYDIKKGAQLPAGDNPVLLWQLDANSFLVECAQTADAEDRLNRTLFMTSSRRLEDIMKYWQYGYDISTRPLFEAVCFNCFRMIRKKEHRQVATFPPDQPLENEETMESAVPIEQHYDAAYLVNVNYVAVQGVDRRLETFFICERCRKNPNLLSGDTPLKLFDITMSDRAELRPESDALRCLNGYVKGQIQPCGLFYVRTKKTLDRTFEHRHGEVNILPKLASHYMDMFAIMFEKKPAAITEDVQTGDELRLTQSALDQLVIKNAISLFREHNHLFKTDPKKTAADVVGAVEEMVLLPLYGEIAAADHPMNEVNYGIVHPKNSGVPDIVRVAYGSEYLEEKVWAHIFWQGTGFYQKTAAAAGWSRRN